MSNLLKFLKPGSATVRPTYEIRIQGEQYLHNQCETNPLVPQTLKYLKVWKRLKIKVLSQIRLKRIMMNTKNLGVENRTHRQSISTFDIENYFKGRADDIQNSKSKKPITSFSLNPASLCRRFWDLYLSIWLIYSCILTPVELAFFDVQPLDGLFIIDMIIDFSFLLDVFLNFFTGFYDKEGALHMGNKEIMVEYLKCWFIIDLTASFPSGVVELALDGGGGFSHYNNIAKIGKIRNVTRLLKVSRAVKFFKYTKNESLLNTLQNFLQISYPVRRALTTIFAILISIHIFSCFFYFTSVYEEFPPSCWVVKFGYQDSAAIDIYITSAYFALLTLATIGYGDITPSTDLEICLTIVWIAISNYFLSFVISSLSSSVSLSDMKRTLIDQKFILLDRFTEEVGIDKITKKRMQDEIKLGILRSTYSSNLKGELIQELSGDLKYTIATKMYAGVFQTLKFFQDKDQIFISSIFPLLEAHHYIENEVIYAENDFADYIFFLGNGVVHYIYGENNTTFRVLNSGEYFGDIEIIKHTRRMFSVISPKQCFLLGMGLPIVNKIKKDFSIVWNEFKKEAEIKQKRLIRSLAEMKVLLNLNVQGQIGKIKSKDLKFNVYEEIQTIGLQFSGKSNQSTMQDLLSLYKSEVAYTKERCKRIEHRLLKWRSYKKLNQRSMAWIK